MKTLFVTLLALLLLSGCSSLGGDSSSTRFYALSTSTPEPISNNQQLRLGIGPVRMPRLLKRPQIVTRKNAHELSLSEANQWGGSLEDDVKRVIADNLSSLLGTEQIEDFPWRSDFKADYQVRVEVEQLDGEPGKEATLKARWWLRVGNSPRDKLAKYSVYTTPLKGAGYNDYVAGLSRLLELLSTEIANSIK